jgi:prepilin-type N-terminal cleavage/methylation domain-containing protein
MNFPTLRPPHRRAGFTLVELLVVVGIMVIMAGLITPAITSLKGSGDETKATFDISGAIQMARTYAVANDTYTWVGFFEEDGSRYSTTPATGGVGRIVLATVASRDGTIAYNPATLASVTGTAAISGTSLILINPLIKISNMHLKTAISGDSVFPMGTGTGQGFSGRPQVSATYCQIGDQPASSARTCLFQYPPGSTAVQYSFSKLIQFNPRGETSLIVNNAAWPPAQTVEIGLQKVNGNAIAVAYLNVAAIQITGIAGNIEIYRK